MMIICAKLFLNPTMYNKVMGWTQTGSTEVYAQSVSAECDFDLQPSDMVLIPGMIKSDSPTPRATDFWGRASEKLPPARPRTSVFLWPVLSKADVF